MWREDGGGLNAPLVEEGRVAFRRIGLDKGGESLSARSVVEKIDPEPNLCGAHPTKGKKVRGLPNTLSRPVTKGNKTKPTLAHATSAMSSICLILSVF